MEWCRNMVFYVATEFWPRSKGFLSRQYIFRLRQSWPSQEFSIAIECFYVAIECGQMKRFCVAT